MQNLNLTLFPTFFGCNATSGPLVLYLPNAPWTMYSNYSYMQSSFTDKQLDMMLDNSLAMATYGNAKGNSSASANATVNAGQGWSACLACGVIQRSVARVGMALPDVCTRCFAQHCWNGEEDNATVSQATEDHKPILNPGLTFAQWNQTWFSS